MVRYLVSLISFFIIISCNQQKENGSFSNRDALNYNNTASIYSNSVDPVTIDVHKSDDVLNTSSIIDTDHKIIKLETTDDCLIGEVSKVVIDQEKIYILDSKIAKKVFCFDMSGKFLYPIGKLGGGPEEMDNPKDFEVTANDVHVIDRQCRVFTFDKEGKYRKVFRMPFLTTQICAFDNTSLFLYSNSDTENKYYLTKIEGSEVKSVNFPIQSHYVEAYAIPQAFNRNGNTALFVKFLCDTIFTLSENQLSPTYVIKFPNTFSESVFTDENELQKVFNNTGRFWRLGHMSMAHTNSDLFFISFGEKVYHHFLDRKLSKHKAFYRISDDYFFGGLGATPPAGNYQDYFIYPISMPPMMAAYKNTLAGFEERKNEKEINDFNTNFSDFMTLCERSNEDDNPALLLTKINPRIYEE